MSDSWQQILTYLLSNIRTLLLRMVILLIFGFAFLFMIQSLCSEVNICGQLKVNSLEFIKIDLSNNTDIIRSLVFSFIVGQLLQIFGVWCFRFFRKLRLESYSITRWKIKKAEENNVTVDKIIVGETYDYLEKHPYVADIHTLNHFYSTITRPLFATLAAAILLFFSFYSVEWYILWILLCTTLFVVLVGLSADKEENDFIAGIRKILVAGSQSGQK